MRNATLAASLFLLPLLAHADSAIHNLRVLAGADASSVALGQGYVEGTVRLSCPDMGWGRMNGSVLLSGKVRVHDADGRSGEIAVSGSAFLDGRCRAWEAAAKGKVRVSGSGTLRASDGGSRKVRVAGEVPVELTSAAGSVWLRAHVDVKEF